MTEENEFQSNRLFFYPPFQLPPLAMSANECFQLWFLIDNDPIVLSVLANVNWNINDLTKAAMNEACLGHLKSSDVVLWKLNDPIQIKPARTLTERLPSPISNISVALEEPTDTVLDIFPRSLAKGHLHMIVKRRAVELAGVPMSRTPTAEMDWSVFGAINRLAHYHVDPATQTENQRCLDGIRKQKFCLLLGSPASGKTTRLFRIRTQLDEANVWSLYVSLHGLSRYDPSSFWQSFGYAVAYTARMHNIPFPEITISSGHDFLWAFHVNNWSRRIVLLLDELSELYNASDDVRNQCLGALREIKDNHGEYAISSILAAGTFSIVHLNPTDRSLSPLNVASHVQNPNFTLDETRALFLQFTNTTGIKVDDDIIEDVWARTGGHPGMICLCGSIISQNTASLLRHDTLSLSYQNWIKFPDTRLYDVISAHKMSRSMVESLHRPDAKDAVRLLRSDFLGYSGDVTLLDYDDQRLADFLTAQGVLFKPDRVSPTYHMTSALVDGILRRNVIFKLFPNVPRILLPLDGPGQTLDCLSTITESLKCFDKEHIRLAALCSFKLSKAVKVDGRLNAQVPRESVYDTELLRILSNWLQSFHGWTVTGQWHLKNPFRKNRYTDIVLKKEGQPTIVLEMLATGDEECLNLHIDKTPEYMDLFDAQKAWIIHFTREDHYIPVWQSCGMLNKGVNLVHVWHNLEFTNVRVIAKWKDGSGVTHLDIDWQTISV